MRLVGSMAARFQKGCAALGNLRVANPLVIACFLARGAIKRLVGYPTAIRGFCIKWHARLVCPMISKVSGDGMDFND